MHNSTLTLEAKHLHKHYLKQFRNQHYPKYKVDANEIQKWRVYKSTLQQFTQYLEAKNKTLLTVSHEDVTTFLNKITNINTYNSKRKHIKALLNFLVINNEEYYNNITKDQVRWMLSL